MKKGLFTAVALSVPLLAWADWGSNFHGGGHMIGYEGHFMFMGLFWLGLLGLIVWLALAFIKNSASTSSKSADQEAIQIVKNRFARGEITKEEMDELLSHLK